MSTTDAVLLIILGPIVVFFAYILPIITAVMAHRRKRQGWMIASIISLFLGAGFIVGPIAYLELSKQPLKSQLKSPCPECGGADGYVKMRNFYADNPGQAPLATGIGGLILVFIMALGCSATVFWAIGSVIALIPLLSVVRETYMYLSKNRITEFSYTCDTCQHEWMEKVEIVAYRNQA